MLSCMLDPVRMFTLSNTGNVMLTGISNTLSGATADLANYANLGTTCAAPPGTLAPGGTCVIAVQFKPLTAQAAGLKAITLNVTDSAGTQSAAINGTAR
jgi:hypothetical protein